MLTTDNDKKHHHRPVETLAEVLEDIPFESDQEEIKECYEVARKIADTKRRISNSIYRNMRNILRQQRDKLYREFKQYSYDTRFETYRALTVAEREAIPWRCWMHGYDPFEYP